MEERKKKSKKIGKSKKKASPSVSKKTPEFDLSEFNPEEIQKEFQKLIQKKFGGNVQVLSMTEHLPFEKEKSQKDFSEKSQKSEKSEKREEEKPGSIESFNFKPREIKNHLDRFVIGQESAKKALSIAICDHYNHLKAEDKGCSQLNYQKQNLLILGPTGVGKTYLIKLISSLIGVPFIKADATRFSEVGYMGANVDDIVRDLVEKADGNKKLAEKGIVYVDEVDKLAGKKDYVSRDISGRGVQFGFLRLLENTDVDLNGNHDMASQFKTFMNFQKKGKSEKEVVNTKNILFIFSGAFHGLEEIINARLNKKSIGLHTEKKIENQTEVFKKLTAKDLVDFGFEHEFIGRIPVKVTCENLGERQLYEILINSEQSILHQYKNSFKHYGITLKFKQVALKMIAKKAFEQKTGARALSSVFEEILRPFKFELPSTPIKELEISEDLVRNPLGFFYHLTSNLKMH